MVPFTALSGLAATLALLVTSAYADNAKTCNVKPLGHGKDDTNQVRRNSLLGGTYQLVLLG